MAETDGTAHGARKAPETPLIGGRPGGAVPDGAVPGAEPISLTALIVLVGTFAAIVFHYVAGAYLGLGYPWDTFLYAPNDRFMDFVNMHELARTYGTGGEHTLIYSPAMHFAVRVLALAPAAAGLALISAAFVAAVTATAFAATARLRVPLLRWLHTAVLALLGYPVLFALDRGNLEVAVFVLLALWAYLHYVKRSRWAWVVLGAAIACKYYAVTLLILPLLDRRYRDAALAVVTAVAATVLGAVSVAVWAGLSPFTTLRDMFGTLGGHVGLSDSVFTLPHSHSLWSVLMLVNRLTDYSIADVPHLRTLYIAVALVLFGFVVYSLWRREYHEWARLTLVMACTTLLPFQSGDYTLIHLLIPLALFSCRPPEGRAGYVIAALFGLLFIPLDYFYFTFRGLYWSVSISVFIYPVVLVLLTGWVLQTGLRDSLPSRAAVAIGE